MFEFYKNFQNIKYIDSSHLYYDSNTGENLISVTTLLKKLRPTFESIFWANYTALKQSGFTNLRPMKPYKIMVDGSIYDIDDIKTWDLKVTYKDVLKNWEITSKIGTTLGSYLHNTIENKIHRKELVQEMPSFLNRLNSVEVVKYVNARQILNKLADNFYEEMIENYIPALSEFVVGQTDILIAGTFDLLVFNKNTETYELWDFKTDKEIKTKSDYGDKIKWFNVDDCELNKYSLQLGIYKYLIENNTSIKVDKCKIIHFKHKEGTYTFYDTLDFNKEIKEFFADGNNKSIYI